jgi:hypothetical protein
MEFKKGDKALTALNEEVTILNVYKGDYLYELLDKSILIDKDDDGIFLGNFLKPINKL